MHGELQTIRLETATLIDWPTPGPLFAAPCPMLNHSKNVCAVCVKIEFAMDRWVLPRTLSGIEDCRNKRFASADYRRFEPETSCGRCWLKTLPSTVSFGSDHAWLVGRYCNPLASMTPAGQPSEVSSPARISSATEFSFPMAPFRLMVISCKSKRP